MLDFEGLRTGAGIFDVLSRAQTLERQGKRVLHFEIGQPDFCTPDSVKNAAKKALDENFTGYVSAGGILELKEAIQDEIEVTRGFRPTLNQILVVPGGNSAIYYMIRAASENPLKEEIIHPNPGFPTYRAVVHYLKAGNISLPLKEKNEFRLNPSDVEEKITSKTKVIVLNSPQNPTGSVMKKEEIIRIAELAEENNIYLLSDEIYSKMTYDEKFYSCSERDECKERTVILDGFSKAYSMTGWRLGYVIGPERIIDRMGLLISMTVSCVNAFIQKAGVAALILKEPQEELKRNMKAFRKRRDAIVEGLNSISGFSCLGPQGAFYVFPNIVGTGQSSKELADKLLEENGIACLPGTV
ncbi:MAG: aminotransferase class I/II-fold pyridoxal phosphate-dependent enzyme, partial [Candidatus Hodarchaeales archaeon]